MSLVVLRDVRLRGVDWWSLRSSREQALLIGLAAVTVLALLFTLIWGPLLAVRRDALQDIRTYRALAAQVRVAGPALAGRAAGAASSTAGVAASAAGFGLVIRRLEPQGSRTRVVVEDAQFDRMLRWIERLERDGVRVEAVRLERRPAPGVVNAQLTLGT